MIGRPDVLNTTDTKEWIDVTDKEQEDNSMSISVEYSPMELTTLLQLLDYLDISMLQNGVPIGIVSLHRQKLYDKLLKEDVREELDNEKQEKKEEFGEMFKSSDDEISFPNRDGFQ